MAFGIPNSGGETSNGEFLGRIQYDARVGFWTIVKRVQTSDGWMDEKSEPFKNLQFLLDFGSLEVGFIKLTSPPSFLVVPYGQTIPSQPEEMQQHGTEKPRKAFQPGFRVKLCSPKTFGDNDAYYFTNSSKTVMGPMDALHQRYLVEPEAASGKVPVVAVTKSQSIAIKGAQGTNTYYAPVFDIIGWADRVEAFGARTVPAPLLSGVRVAPPPVHTPAPVHSAPANHVPPPVRAAPIMAEAMPF